MSPYKRGDVVMLYFPYEDRDESKYRPAIILEDEDDPLFLFIQCTKKNRSDTNKGIWVIKDTQEGRMMGIVMDTFINISRTAKLPKYAIYRKIGSCPYMDRIDDILNE